MVEVEEALQFVQSHNLFLHYDERLGVDLWTPNAAPVPLAVRRSVFVHRAQILDRMRAYDALTCPAPQLHKRTWKAGSGRNVCLECLLLGGYVEGKTA